MIRSWSFLLYFTIIIPLHLTAQQVRVGGKVAAADTGEPLAGVSIMVDGSTKGASTGEDGTFEISVLPTDKLVFSFTGMEPQTLDVGARTYLEVALVPVSDELEEVTVVAFGTQKKESVVASITTVNTKDLLVPSSNLTASFAGKIPGLISYQTTGEPGRDNAQFFIRGVTTFGYKADPLILIDGFEASTDDLARLQPDDIEAFSILKDASATVLYGARGANGIVSITTKSGKAGERVAISARFDANVSSPTSMLELLDGVSYMRAYNEARLSRHNDEMSKYEGDPAQIVPMGNWYSEEKIQATLRGENPMVFPNVNWYDALMKNNTVNSRFNMNLSGGGQVATYYVSAGVDRETGLLKVDNQDNLNNFNSNIDISRYSIRTNVIFNLGKTTQLDTRISGRFQKYNSPFRSAGEIFDMVMGINPVEFPAVWLPDERHQYTRNTMFGMVDPGLVNPFAEMVRGYTVSDENNISAQATLKQDLGNVMENLKLELKASVNTWSASSQTRSYNPVYYALENYDDQNQEYTLYPLNPNETGRLGDVTGGRNGETHYYFEGRLNWNNSFGPHNLGFMTVGFAGEKLLTNGSNGSIYETLPERNVGNSSRFTYDYDSRYFLEASYGYNGSEKFDKSHRFGFFPSIGFGWVVSNEPYYTDGLKRVFDLVKLKLTHGKVGNDAIAGRSGRFFFLSDIYAGGGMYSWGRDFLQRYEGYSVARYNNPNIQWEVSTISNLGLELGLLNGLNIQVDYFHNIRDKIYWPRNNIPQTMGYEAVISGNIGKVKSQGIDGSVDYKHFFSNSFWMTARVNATYATNRIVRTDEPSYKEWYLYTAGQPIGQQWGYVAERLFVDQEEIDNSPSQIAFGSYMRGDIKYTDVNQDGVINENDRIPIGYPTVPQLQYGFGASLGWKKVDFSFFFQGNSRVSFFINPSGIAPLVNRRNAPAIIARDSWSETNPDVHAFWPRLAVYEVNNNVQPSTWWLRDGSFMRLKTLEVGYSPGLLGRVGIAGGRIYLSGENLFSLSSFRLWDPEMGGNGLAYPINRRINMGVQLSF
ncbi:SusC/RagA family TonB-linked outer membrane protein [Parapedobacter sp. 2B3]|uniref:SusC/RagA family TonB-linked outer membrane protein n=1 Tax=Parapedobacter sp. 2B3 TaxID=3342381 RepID=UPI0035B6907C